MHQAYAEYFLAKTTFFKLKEEKDDEEIDQVLRKKEFFLVRNSSGCIAFPSEPNRRGQKALWRLCQDNSVHPSLRWVLQGVQGYSRDDQVWSQGPEDPGYSFCLDGPRA